MIKHPCLSCGACCSYFRVSFHWMETEESSHGIPILLTEKISLHHSAMIGTNMKNPRCNALDGVISKSVSCSIYKNRPDSCRTFLASYEDGFENLRCDQARISKGMLALTLSDWF